MEDKGNVPKIEILANSDSLNFDGNNAIPYQERKYDKIKIIERGELPIEFHSIITEIFKEICVNQTRNKMCSFYIIKTPHQLKIYVAISGSQDKNFNPFVTKINKNKLLKGKVSLIPFSKERIPLERIENPEESDFLNRADLFIKFLITTVSYFGKPNEYGTLKQKFILTEEHDEYLKELKALAANPTVIAAFNNYKTHKNTDISLLDYLCQNIFVPIEIAPKQQKLIENSIFRNLKIIDLKTKKKIDIDIEEQAKYIARESLGEIPQNIIDKIYINMKMLWDHLSRFSDFEISHKLAHCAESNLIDYLHEHQELLEEEGEHYVFNLKINTPPDYTLCELCDICNVNVNEHFSYLSNAVPEVLARIPIRVNDHKPIKNLKATKTISKNINSNLEHSPILNPSQSVDGFFEYNKPVDNEIIEFINKYSLKILDNTENTIKFELPTKCLEEFADILNELKIKSESNATQQNSSMQERPPSTLPSGNYQPNMWKKENPTASEETTNVYQTQEGFTEHQIQEIQDNVSRMKPQT
jgi:hypothetical protein